jgi:hypothetical protein
VLLLEAGGTDDVPSVREARQWITNFGTERHWNFQAEPNPLLNGRRLPLNMGKVPCDWYAKIAPDDLDAIVAYLRSLKPLKTE